MRRRQPKRVAVVVFPGFQLLDATGPIAAFEIASRLVRDAYEVSLVAARPGAVRSSAGVALEAAGAAHRRAWDPVLVSGGRGTRGPNEPSVPRFLLGAASRA